MPTDFVASMSKTSPPNPTIQKQDYANKDCDDSLLARLHRALGPLAGGVILDGADFLTFGPIGLVFGLFIGAAVGWWVSSIYRFSHQSRIAWSALAGLYCAIPFTSIIPLATLISVAGRFRPRESSVNNVTADADVYRDICVSFCHRAGPGTKGQLQVAENYWSSTRISV